MNMWQEGSVLPVTLLSSSPPWFDHVCTQVPSDKVQIRTNSEGVQMVFGTCPILVEGNEYIFRWEMFTNVIENPNPHQDQGGEQELERSLELLNSV